MSAVLEVRGLTVRYGDVVAVDGVSLRVEGGTLAALVGPSGCGKTSMLRAIAGFEPPAAGSVSVGGEVLNALPPQKRRIGMLFQEGALFPHLTVMDNAAFGLERRERGRALDVLRLVGMEDLAGRYPHELSGGQQQRVALARALAPQPRLILLDEPFVALDAALRGRLREEICDLLRRLGTTAVLVTHDQEEALSVTDQVSVMWQGRILQTGPPREVYESPATLQVAEVVGDANLIEAEVVRGAVATPFGTLRAEAPDGPCVLRIATGSLSCAPQGAEGTITGSRFYGHDVVDEVTLPSGLMVRVRQPRPAGEIGARVHLVLERRSYRLFRAGEAFTATWGS